MRHEKRFQPEPRIFIAGLRVFEIVYLPETGQIVSRIPASGKSFVVETSDSERLRGEVEEGERRD